MEPYFHCVVYLNYACVAHCVLSYLEVQTHLFTSAISGPSGIWSPTEKVLIGFEFGISVAQTKIQHTRSGYAGRASETGLAGLNH